MPVALGALSHVLKTMKLDLHLQKLSRVKTIIHNLPKALWHFNDFPLTKLRLPFCSKYCWFVSVKIIIKEKKNDTIDRDRNTLHI